MIAPRATLLAALSGVELVSPAQGPTRWPEGALVKRFFGLLFMPCDGISGLVSESLDRDLTLVERFALRLHLLYCAACRRYRKHILAIRTLLHAAETTPSAWSELKLSPQARARMTDLLKP